MTKIKRIPKKIKPVLQVLVLHKFSLHTDIYGLYANLTPGGAQDKVKLLIKVIRPQFLEIHFFKTEAQVSS